MARQWPGWEEPQATRLPAEPPVGLAPLRPKLTWTGASEVSPGPGSQPCCDLARAMPGTALPLSYFNAGHFRPDCSVP